MTRERNSLLEEENFESITTQTNDAVLDLDTLDEPHPSNDIRTSARSSPAMKLEPISEPVIVHDLDSSTEVRCADVTSELFEVAIRVIEARQLPGLDLNAMVRLKIGSIKKNTSVQKSTNNPYFDEYFVFNFNQPRIEIFQKVINITVKDVKGLIESDVVLGSFSCDIGTIFSQPGHRFMSKWAILTDPQTNEHRGYLRLDISVNFKNDEQYANREIDDDDGFIKDKSKVDQQQEKKSGDQVTKNEDIESNLLLPKGTTERQSIKLIVKVYRAYGLTRPRSGLSGTLKSLAGSKDTISPYVCVSFGGKSGKTSTVKKNSSPVWNQQIIFLDSFPPFFQSIKIEIKDDELGTDSAIATHFVHLNDISSDGQDGYLPTYGPTFVNLYGAPPESGGSDRKSLTSGLQEGVTYSGRLLIAITTEFVDLVSPDLESVALQNIGDFNESLCGPKREFSLFGVLYCASRIDEKYRDKGVSYELNMGDPNDLDADGKVDDGDKIARKQYRGVTATMKPERCFSNKQENSYFLNLETVKPIMSHRFQWVDDTWRLMITNRLISLKQYLEIGLADVDAIMITNETKATCRMLGVLDQLISGLNQFMRCTSSSTQNDVASLPGITKLDMEKMRSMKLEIQLLIHDVSSVRHSTAVATLADTIQSASLWIRQLAKLTRMLHSTVPDIFFTMLVDDKRIGQVKIPARDILYTPETESRGWYCSKFRTILLREAGLPSGKIVGQAQISCWFGLSQYLNTVPDILLEGYDHDEDLVRLGQPGIEPPTYIKYSKNRDTFEFRAHLFQGRSLIGGDSSGLSDPYAKIYFGRCVSISHVETKTLSPMWDELLVGPKVTLIGSRQSLKRGNFSALVELYDHDQLGEDEFLGRSLVYISRDHLRFADEPYKPPTLAWYDVWRDGQEGGQILIALELIQISPSDNSEDYPAAIPSVRKIRDKQEVYSIPPTIRPTLSKYRLQVIFWGVRDLKKFKWSSIDRPRVDIDCGGSTISSAVISNYKKNSNFPNYRKEIDLMLPDQNHYCPPLSIRVGDCRAFGRFSLIGSHLIRSLSRIMFTEDEHIDYNNLPKKHIQIEVSHGPFIGMDYSDSISNGGGGGNGGDTSNGVGARKRRKPDEDAVILEMESDEDGEIDWWVRYSASRTGMIVGKRDGSKLSTLPYRALMKIYSDELERHYPSNRGRLESFPLKRGKLEEDSSIVDDRYAGIFKGALQLYKYPLKNYDVFQSLPNNDPVAVIVRVYLIRAYDVKPTDMNGKADLYPVIKLGSHKICESDNYVPNCLDPTFGRMYEFEVTFPRESILYVSLKDHDAFSVDELIGTTRIDLEDRFYSHRRMTCGLPRTYEISGPCKWRDSLKPSQILTKLCREMKLAHLVITKKYVQIGRMIFSAKENKQYSNLNSSNSSSSIDEEQLCLGVLNCWKEASGYSLVPEHIETRSLYRPDKPGVKQGKIEMFVDIFRANEPKPLPINIVPCKPRSYELRVIIWNTKDVILDDDSIVGGEKMSDIYIKGWLTDPLGAQKTDVHYRSVTGEGNFNWRFIFAFDYLPTEGLIVVKRKENFFSLNSTEIKLPCRLNLQAWDYDSFSGDDFLGCLPLDLLDFPRGVRTAKECDLSILDYPSSGSDSGVDGGSGRKRGNLFRDRRCRGWWPLYARSSDGSMELTGKIEADFELLTKEEATVNPAGLGREGPLPLEKPVRPENSFLWFTNPWKSFKYILWSRRKWLFFKIVIFLFLFIFLLLFFYSLPGYTVKKILGA
ncbi:ferlin family C2 domain-containing myoferlin misfire [Brevipalpus obovatus]|uniref:ferlin family C2 domain-containing myoferlin misfire n=1 Tax=Brevipalpus obovatus TaxID=246614 RepID=UPI003D9E54F2